MSFQTCSCVSTRRAFRLRSIRHSLAPASGRAGLAGRPDNNLPEGCEMPFKVPSEAPGQSPPEQSEAAPTVIQNQPGYLRDKAVSTAVAIALGIIVLLALLFANAPYSRGHFKAWVGS